MAATERVVTEIVITADDVARAERLVTGAFDAMGARAAAMEAKMQAAITDTLKIYGRSLPQAVEQVGSAYARLQAKLDPIIAAQQRFEREMAQSLGVVNRAVLLGVTNEQEAAATISRLRQRQIDELGRVRDANAQVDRVASNDNSVRFRRQNSLYQVADITQGAALGMPASMIALQQLPQLAQNYVGDGGGLKAVREDLGAVLTGARAAGSALVELVGIPGLIASGFGIAAAAVGTYLLATRSAVKDADTILAEHEAFIRKVGDAYPEIAKRAKEFGRESKEVLKTIGADRVADQEASLRAATKSLAADYQPMIDPTLSGDIFKALPEALPYADTFKRLGEEAEKRRPDIAGLREEIVAIRQALSDPAAQAFGKAFLEATDPAKVLADLLPATAGAVRDLGDTSRLSANQVELLAAGIDRFADALTRLKAVGKPDLTPLAQVEKDFQTGLSQPGLDARDLQTLRRERDAAVSRLADQDTRDDAARRTGYDYDLARNDSMRVIMARRRAGAEWEAQYGRQRNGIADPGMVRAADIAEQEELARITKELTDAQDARTRSLDAQMRSAQESLGLIGQTAGETARLTAINTGLAAIDSEIAQHGSMTRDNYAAEIKLLNEKAEALGKAADAAARMKLADDLAFDRSQILRSPLDQQVAQTQRSAGLAVDLGTADADAIRQNITLQTSQDILRSGEERIRQLQSEAGAIGLTGTALDAYTFKQQAFLDAMRAGISLGPDYVAMIEKQADAYAKAAQQARRAQMVDDIRFEGQQMNRSPLEQGIYQRFRGTGIDPNGPEGDALRQMDFVSRQREAFGGFAHDFADGILNQGKSIGEALGDAIRNSAARALEDALDQGIEALGRWLFPAPELSLPQTTATMTVTAAVVNVGGAGALALSAVPGASTAATPGAIGGVGGAANSIASLVPGYGSTVGANAGILGGGDIAAMSWKFWKSKGFADHQVAGILGNMKAESAFRPDVDTGDGGNAWGLFQWNDRRHAMVNSVGSNWRNNPQGQLEFAWKELQTSEGSALRALMNSKNTREATAAFAGFERPRGFSWANPEGAHNFSGRYAGAEQAMAKFGGSAQTASGALEKLANGGTNASTGLAALANGGANATSGLNSFTGGLGQAGNALTQFLNGATGGQGWSLTNLFGLGLSNTGAGFVDGRGGGIGGWLGLADGGQVGPSALRSSDPRDEPLRRLDPAGMVRGPGTSRSDDVPAWLSDGEYVVNAASTARHRSLIEAVNRDDPAMIRRELARGFDLGMPVHRLADGGPVTAAYAGARSIVAPSVVPVPRPVTPPAYEQAANRSRGGNVTVNRTIHNYAGVEVEEREERDDDGTVNIETFIRRTARDEVTRPGKKGERQMRQTYGLSRKVREN